MSNNSSNDATAKLPLRHYDACVRTFIQTFHLAKEKDVPSEVLASLEKALKLTIHKDEFVERMTSKDSEGCQRLQSEAIGHDWGKVFDDGNSDRKFIPQMISGTLAGQFLKSFVSIQRAKRVLEVGMFTGFGALSMAEGLPDDGEVVTMDNCPYLEKLVRPLLDQYPHGKKVKIAIGDASHEMRERVKKGETFDIVFIDADKCTYPTYLKICFEENLLAPNGTVLVDNAFQGLNAYDPEAGENDAKTFAAHVAAQKDLHTVLLPIRDGLYMIRRLSDVERSKAQ